MVIQKMRTHIVAVALSAILLLVIALAVLACRPSKAAAAPPTHSRAVVRAPQGTAVLVTGELRFESEDALDAFCARLAKCHVYVATWAKFATIARRLVATEDDMLLVREPSKKIPHPASYQFELLQEGVRHFADRLRGAPMVVRMRTDAVYGDDFAIPSVEAGVVAMESDHATTAEPETFIRAYGNILDDMVERGVYMHREEQRSLFPNWNNYVRSDISNVDKGGWRTRWRWLDYPVEVFPHGVGGHSADIIPHIRAHLPRLNAMRGESSIPTRMLTSLARVPKFDAESAFLHHTLEHAAVIPLDRVDFVGREHRCPYKAPCLVN